MRYWRQLRIGWAQVCHAEAASIRAGWAAEQAEWERLTEPGYPMTGLMEDRKRLGLGFADLLDALAFDTENTGAA